jgi:hypothetical protein
MIRCKGVMKIWSHYSLVQSSLIPARGIVLDVKEVFLLRHSGHACRYDPMVSGC